MFPGIIQQLTLHLGRELKIMINATFNEIDELEQPIEQEEPCVEKPKALAARPKIMRRLKDDISSNNYATNINGIKKMTEDECKNKKIEKKIELTSAPNLSPVNS